MPVRRCYAPVTAGALLLGVFLVPEVGAQVDPLLFLKRTPPNVLLAIDLSSRMQRDAHEVYLDPVVFAREGAPFEDVLGVHGVNTERAYRRRYPGLAWLPPGGGLRGTASTVDIVGDRDPAFVDFDRITRLARARAALLRVLDGNRQSVRFGLLTSRQAAPTFPTVEWPSLAIEDPARESPTDTGLARTWKAGIPAVASAGADQPAAPPPVAADGPGANDAVATVLAREPREAGALLPSGFDGPLAVDAPIGLLLDDARAEAARLAAGDTDCRNTVVVLVVAGADPAAGATELGEKASQFLRVSGRRVPIYVVALAPPPADVEALRLVASRSGGQYSEMGPDLMDRAGGGVVHELVRAVNVAVQHAFADFDDMNMLPSPVQPHGQPSEFQTSGVVVGTVNLEGATDIGGAALLDTRVTTPAGVTIEQRSNVMITAGFELPGFLGRIRAFRLYRPVADRRQATGYRFTADGTRLWVAATPAAESRNIYTVVPGVGVTAVRSESSGVLAPFLLDPDPAGLIEQIRARPLGAVVSSTPAILEPPSMAWPAASYRAFAETHRNRRALVFVGAADGMLHALDARSGVEVWAVIPFNLLPRLRALRDGQPVDAFQHGVDASPRIADVEVGGTWRTVLLFGEGPGGTFYQAFDVSLDGVSAVSAADLAGLLAWFADPGRIPFMWSFPRYEQFDPSQAPFGELRASASDAEKSVGLTWSTPAVARVGSDHGPLVALLGSGGLSRRQEQLPGRGGQRAGTRLYMLAAASGMLLDFRDVGSDGVGEEDAVCPGVGCGGLKNALLADPVVAGSSGRLHVDRAYVGDLDGRLWRFDVGLTGGSGGFTGDPRLLFDAGASHPIIGAVGWLSGTAGQGYVVFGTGADTVAGSGGTDGGRLIGLRESVGSVTLQFDRPLGTAGGGLLPERAGSAPAVAGGVVFFSTTTARANRCQPAEARLYALTPGGGAAYDTNGDGRRDGADGLLVGRPRAGRATAPVVAGRHLFMAAGKAVQMLGDPEGFNLVPGFPGIRILSWREVR